MTTPANFVLRAFYIVAGTAVIVFSIVESSRRAILYAPVIFGILLIVQGLSGA